MYIQELIQASHGFVAKTDRENEELYLPVWMHALDTAGVMDYLVEKWLSENTVRQKVLFSVAFASADRGVEHAASAYQPSKL